MKKELNLMKSTSQFAECVGVVTAAYGGKENAMPATWCAPVSFSPTMVTIHISPARFTHELVKRSKEFGLNLLAEDQVPTSRFAGSCSGRDTNKIEKMDVFHGEKIKAPLLKGCVANMECKVVDAVEAGDHTIFVGRVENLYYDGDKRPLLLFRGGYHKLGDSLGKY
jgi:flavin reductase (DIM6/NTAB) family NADH-FMN oxidoreductase RutF